MDNGQFDEVVKQLSATRVTRGTALRGVLGGAAALVGARLALNETDARKKKRKSKNKGRNAGIARSTSNNKGGGNSTCPSGQTSSPRINAEDLGPLNAFGCAAPITLPVIKNGVKECDCDIQVCLTEDATGVYYGGGTTCKVGTVIVKGGPDSAASTTCTEQMPCYAPKLKNGKYPAVSNITFCGFDCPVTPPPPGVCLHSSPNAAFPDGGCMPSCTTGCAAADKPGKQCGVICGTGPSNGACPVGNGNGNPCCSTGYCDPANYKVENGVCSYTPGTCNPQA